MTHTGPVRESDGDFGEWQPSPRPCPYCKAAGQRYYRVWESHCGGYVDEQNRCLACGKVWWVEGPDA